jgi:hypothetical protein
MYSWLKRRRVCLVDGDEGHATSDNASPGDEALGFRGTTLLQNLWSEMSGEGETITTSLVNTFDEDLMREFSVNQISICPSPPCQGGGNHNQAPQAEGQGSATLTYQTCGTMGGRAKLSDRPSSSLRVPLVPEANPIHQGPAREHPPMKVEHLAMRVAHPSMRVVHPPMRVVHPSMRVEHPSMKVEHPYMRLPSTTLIPDQGGISHPAETVTEALHGSESEPVSPTTGEYLSFVAAELSGLTCNKQVTTAQSSTGCNCPR